MDPFLGELKLVSFGFAPKGWSLANGALLAIQTNQALFSLFGTTYGGDGRTTFGLPNLQGRVPISFGGGNTQGQVGGSYSVTVSLSQMPAHSHGFVADNAAKNAQTPANGLLANTSGALGVYGPAVNLGTMSPAMVSTVGGNQAHTNQSPYLVMNWIVALQGIFPSQN
jgi:microcystin-dependent protein